MDLAGYQDSFGRLMVNVREGRASPHKICMLLAVLDLARGGALTINRINYGPELLQRYHAFFRAVKRPTDHPNPYFPFFHLGGRLRGGRAPFWHLVPKPGREQVLAAMSTARSHADVINNIDSAVLDLDLFVLLQSPPAVEVLADTLARRWFDRGLQDLLVVSARSGQVSAYERSLRGSGQVLVAQEPAVPCFVRSAAFRRVVLQAYDYRCAASGLRLLLDDAEALVEAAHIRPFADSGDDDPRNGLALTPNMHWAMDRNLIAPGPDMRWHVSPALDRRIADLQPLVALHGQALFRPTEARWSPRQDVLIWRRERLRDSGWRGSEV